MKKLFIAFAALGLMAGWSCSEFDDSALNGRMDELEGRVDGIESELDALKAKVNGLNDSYKALTWALNGGVISNVEPTADGYRVTITRMNADGTTTTEVLEIKNGAQGAQGVEGAVPELTAALDPATGRYYWVLDGKPMTDSEGNYIYATGEQGAQGTPGNPGAAGTPGTPGTPGAAGAQGEQGVTPYLAVAPDKDGAPDFEAETADGLYWWVSYDYETLDNKDEATWQKLGVVTGTIADAGAITADYDKAAGTLTFYQNGVEIITVEIGNMSGNPLSLSFAVDGEDVDECSVVKILKGESVEITVNIEGASEKAAVKAELQNQRGYNVSVDGTTITVEAVAVADNKLMVEVSDGGYCYHSWLDLTTPNAAWIEFGCVDDYGYMPVAFAGDRAYQGTDFSSLNDVPVNLDVTLYLEVAATKDVTVNLSIADDEDMTLVPAEAVKMPASVTVKKGESSVKIPVTLNRAMLTCDDEFAIDMESDDAEVYNDNWMAVANNFINKVALKGEDLSCQWSHGGASVSLAPLVDGSTEAASYWESYWSVGTAMYTNEDYHIYIDIKLPESYAAVQFKHFPRNYNVSPTSLKYAAVANGTPAELGTKTFDGSVVDWQSSDVYSVPTLTNNVWFGMMESAQGDLYYLEPSPAYCHCVGLREIEVHVMY